SCQLMRSTTSSMEPPSLVARLHGSRGGPGAWKNAETPCWHDPTAAITPKYCRRIIAAADLYAAARVIATTQGRKGQGTKARSRRHVRGFDGAAPGGRRARRGGRRRGPRWPHRRGDGRSAAPGFDSPSCPVLPRSTPEPRAASCSEPRLRSLEPHALCQAY